MELRSHLLEQDLSVRYVLFYIANAVLLIWMRCVVVPAAIGRQRLLRSIPAFALLLFISTLFRYGEESERYMVIYVNTNHLWLAPFKARQRQARNHRLACLSGPGLLCQQGTTGKEHREQKHSGICFELVVPC